MTSLRTRQCCLRLGAVAALALVIAPARALATSVARPGAETAVGEYRGTIVFSAYDQTERRWYLSIRVPGGTEPRRLSIAPSPMPFDADIGTDSDGRPELIYQRCAATTTTVPGIVPTAPITEITRTGCELYVYSLATGTGERAVRNANDGSHDDVNATLWNGRIAWTREYGSGKAAHPVVYTKTLTAPRSQPSRRLPGVPHSRCGDVDKVCGPTADRNVEALELSGDDLAVSVTYSCEGCSGIAQRELRLDDVASGSARRVALVVAGLNGQRFVGPSFFGGRLAWYRACAVSEASCRTFVGPWRYRMSTRTYERGTPGPVVLPGFADTGSSLYEVVDCHAPEAAELNANCRIDQITPPTYSVVPAS